MQNSSSEERKPNRLIKEKSPYLLQHAYNPVDWYPWGPEAFKKAKADDKPVFVSIGYSTCHWCHVMEKECFDDNQVAELMNQNFVSIKVDREERPDLDAAYMAVCQAMGRNCGWPLNVIMTPDKNPFFVASYIPKDNRYGTVGMLSLVPQIREIWKTRKAEMETIGKELKQQIQSYTGSAGEKMELGKSDLDNAFEQLFLRFDPENGGFGNAPKFPSPHNFMFLLRYWYRTKEKTAWNMVEKTLRAMRLGGIFDQIGLGFHRYSTDTQWLVPHFEKMLYDQALLTLAYIEAYQASKEQKFRITAKETIEYVLRDLTSQDGGFYSAEDADSEGEEGKFYLWSYEEIRQALPAEEADLAIRLFNINPNGNYYEPQKGASDKNILHFNKPINQLAVENKITVDQLINKLDKITSTLFVARERRVHPSKDDKILTDWNGMMIAALSRASQVLGEEGYLKAATKAADFFLEKMKTDNGYIYHRYAKGERAVTGFLDDYAYLVFGLIELYEASFQEKFLQAASDLTKTMIVQFWDEKNGGFFFTSQNADEAIPRLKEIYDGATPSGNSVALLNLLRLSQLTNETTFDIYSRKLLKTFVKEIKDQPIGHAFMLVGLEFALGPTFSVVIVGDPAEKETIEMVKALRKGFLPNLTLKIWTADSAKTNSSGVAYEKIDGKTTAYVCRDQTCMPPTNDVVKMMEFLKT
ncbi:MAG: thioredoxin domain-containing protein [Ignavibacteria bacterium]